MANINPNKEFNILFVFLALLCFSWELQAAAVAVTAAEPENVVSVQLVADVQEYNRSLPASNWLELNRTMLHVLGERESGDKLLFVLGETRYLPVFGELKSKLKVTFPGNSTILITSVEMRFKGKVDGHAYVVDGGIGKDFISLIVETAKDRGPYDFKAEIFGVEK